MNTLTSKTSTSNHRCNEHASPRAKLSFMESHLIIGRSLMERSSGIGDAGHHCRILSLGQVHQCINQIRGKEICEKMKCYLSAS